MSKAAQTSTPARSATSLANRIRRVPGWWAVSIGKGSDQRVWAWRWAPPDSPAYVLVSWDQFCVYRAVVEAECGHWPEAGRPTLSKRLPPSKVENAPVQLKLPV